jgi:hypothetical protein
MVEKTHGCALQPHVHIIFWGNISFQNQITSDGYFYHPYFQTHHLIIQFAPWGMALKGIQLHQRSLQEI